MSRAASFPVRQSPTLWGRFVAAFDHALMKLARIANRNGDLPYFGL